MRKDSKPSESAHLYRLNHPLGEYVLDSGRRLMPPQKTVTFSLGSHETRIVALESLRGQSGWLELNLLELESFQHEEHLVFTALTDSNRPLDNEQCEWLLRLSAEAQDIPPTDPIPNLKTTVKRQLQAQLSQLLNKNREYFQRGREKLENWAEDQLQTAERQLRDTRVQLKEAKRLANTVEEQKAAHTTCSGYGGNWFKTTPAALTTARPEIGPASQNPQLAASILSNGRIYTFK